MAIQSAKKNSYVPKQGVSIGIVELLYLIHGTHGFEFFCKEFQVLNTTAFPIIGGGSM